MSGTPIDRPPYTDAEMAGLETAAVLAWFVHWTSHRRAACQCATPEDFEIDHGQRAAEALGRIDRLKEASRDDR